MSSKLETFQIICQKKINQRNKQANKDIQEHQQIPASKLHGGGESAASTEPKINPKPSEENGITFNM